MKSAKIFTSLLALGLPLAISTNAQAAADVTWVSRTGVDANNLNCQITTPCRTFQAAHNQTNAGGTINVLDDGDYGTVSIFKSITIMAAGKIALIRATGLAAVYVNTSNNTDKVVLQGLTIDGVGTAQPGVHFVGSGSVYVIDSTIKNAGSGVFNESATVPSRLFVQRCNLIGNGFGVAVNTSGRVVSVLDSLIDSSTISGLRADSGSIIGVARSVVNAGPTAIATFTGGQVISIGPSNIISGTGSFTTTLPFN